MAKARFETALHSAKIYVFSQDRDLKYTWMYGALDDKRCRRMIGRTDHDLLPPPDRDRVGRAETPSARDAASLPIAKCRPCCRSAARCSRCTSTRRSAQTARSTASCAPRSTSAAIRSLESEQRRLTEELGAALQRYETALRGSHVTVYTQDRDSAVYHASAIRCSVARSVRSSVSCDGTFCRRRAARRSWRSSAACSTAASPRTANSVCMYDGDRALVRHPYRAAARRRRRDRRPDLRGRRHHQPQGQRGASARSHARTHASLQEPAGGDPSDGAADRAPCRHDRRLPRSVQRPAAGAGCLARSAGAGKLARRLAVRTGAARSSATISIATDRRFQCQGPPLLLKPEAAQSLGLRHSRTGHQRDQVRRAVGARRPGCRSPGGCCRPTEVASKSFGRKPAARDVRRPRDAASAVS